MTERMPEDCRRTAETIWSFWPDARSVPPEALRHAETCPSCVKELEAFRSFCERASDEGGEPLSWAKIIPSSRWDRLAERTKDALAGASEPMPVRQWAPAFALAAVAIAVLVRMKTPPKPVLDVPVEAVENREMLEHLDVLENWELIEVLPPQEEARHG